MMLVYKAWRESRARFIGGALLLAVFCCFTVVRPDIFSTRLGGYSWAEYIDSVIFNGPGKIAFVLPVIFLGLGGLLRERANRTAVFSLTLPVSRMQLIGAHLAVGLTELGVMTLLPAILIQSLSGFVHQTYPLSRSLRYIVVRFICGALIFAISFLLSVVFKGEYVAAIGCFIVLICLRPVLTIASMYWVPIRSLGLNPLTTMGGGWLATSGFGDPLRRIGLSVMILIALGLFAIATRITQRQNL